MSVLIAAALVSKQSSGLQEGFKKTLTRAKKHTPEG